MGRKLNVGVGLARQRAQGLSGESLKTYGFHKEACKGAVVRSSNVGGEVDRTLRPGLAALRVAGYLVICDCK